ncbi:MAG: cupin domain-containing protein [Anaerolineae bacterium]|nr:cupin domain-containing protein [Anaerolineae bacterium]
MFTSSKTNAQKRERNGLTSYFLLDRRSVVKPNLAVTWVTVAVGSRQISHHHEPEQVYVIVQGKGEMQVGAETQLLQAGDLVYIPSNFEHGIVNTGNEELTYISAATPPFDLTEAYDRGQLKAESYL